MYSIIHKKAPLSISKISRENIYADYTTSLSVVYITLKEAK